MNKDTQTMTNEELKAAPAPAVPQQSDTQTMLLALARQSLAEYGTPIPPEGTLAASLMAALTQAHSIQRMPEARPVVRDTPMKAPKPPKPEPDWNRLISTCPKCGDTGSVAAKFGTKMQAGVRRKQSWCRNCRATQVIDRSNRKR